MLQSIPALPVGDIKKSIGFYCDKLGFTLVHHEDGFESASLHHLPPIDESEPHYTLELRIHLHGEPK
jgi:catechol 2,3-dioxygenase-like lactoylglutathione lyase family enzyme